MTTLANTFYVGQRVRLRAEAAEHYPRRLMGKTGIVHGEVWSLDIADAGRMNVRFTGENMGRPIYYAHLEEAK